jgi:hypothetical protein
LSQIADGALVPLGGARSLAGRTDPREDTPVNSPPNPVGEQHIEILGPPRKW